MYYSTNLDMGQVTTKKISKQPKLFQDILKTNIPMSLQRKRVICAFKIVIR